MTGRTERQYRRRAHYPARINFGITNELRAALETLADKTDTCVAEVARDCIEAGIGAVRARFAAVEAAQRTKGQRTVNRRRRTREQLDTLDEQRVEVHAGR